MTRPPAAGTAVLLSTAMAVAAAAATAVPAQAAPVICEKFGGTYVQDDAFRVQNNVWGADTAQCIDVDQGGGFTVTQAEHDNATNGAPAAYPSIYAGCHWAQCTSGSELPMQASASGFGGIETSVSVSYPGGGTWNAAYDLWFDPTPRTDGQNTGAEVMIWLNRQGSVQPIGSPVDTVTLAGGTWEVWFGNAGWNVISYLRTSPTTAVDFAVDTFYRDAVARGFAQRSWYLTSVQAGFEPWIGGAGLTVNSFSYTTDGDGGGGDDTTPPSTPQDLSVTGTTSSSVSLAWRASSDNVGVTGYDVFQREGTSGSFRQVGTVGGTSFTAGGLSASTRYEFFVVARDAAENTSDNSSTVTATTDGGGGGEGGCTATPAVQSQWGAGYVLQVTVTNSGDSPISGWSVDFTLPAGHGIVNPWSADFDVDGQGVTAHNLSWNGDLGAGQSAEFGFQASRPDDGQLPTGFSCTAS